MKGTVFMIYIYYFFFFSFCFLITVCVSDLPFNKYHLDKSFLNVEGKINRHVGRGRAFNVEA